MISMRHSAMGVILIAKNSSCCRELLKYSFLHLLGGLTDIFHIGSPVGPLIDTVFLFISFPVLCQTPEDIHFLLLFLSVGGCTTINN